MKNKLFGISALFDSPDAIIKAAEKVSNSGYTMYDVHTPYPVHGMDTAMKLKPSKLGIVTLVFGLSGAAFALLFMWWSMSFEYPIVIGGKPFFSLPAFIPVAFELTVLLATLSTVFGMLMFFFNFPDNNHPLHDTDYMKSVSLDKYGLVIFSSDPAFNEPSINALYTELGGKSINHIYYPEKVTFPIFDLKFNMFLFAVAFLVAGGTYVTLNKLMYLDPFDWMSEQDKLIPQEKSEFFSDSRGMRMPVKGSVARGFIPYPYMGESNPVETLSNPILPTKESLLMGKKKYLTYCLPCHGDFGDGDSKLRGQFPNPPTLHSTRAREFTDGMIYHIITNGQNIMPSHSSQVTREERWAIVNYIRVLQKAKNADASELQVVKKESATNVAN